MMRHWCQFNKSARSVSSEIAAGRTIPLSLSRANYMLEPRGLAGGSWWQGCGATYYHAPKPLLIEQWAKERPCSRQAFWSAAMRI